MDDPPAPTSPNLRATIHIGASAISMLVVEAGASSDADSVEYLEQPLALGRDIFRKSLVSRTTTGRAVEILNGYLETLRELGMGPADVVRAVTTNILAEAANHEVFLNRLSIACGLRFELLDDGEMTRLIFLKTRRRLQDTPSIRKRTSLVVHVGPGNTRILLFKNGAITRYTSYRLGTHRTAEAVEATHADGAALLRVIREQISSQVSQVLYDYENDGIEDLVVIGYEIQLLSPLLTKSDRTKVSLKALRSFEDEASLLSPEERVRRYHIDYNTSDVIVPALETLLTIAELFNLKSLRIPDSDYERGILLDLPGSPSLTMGFQEEVVRSAGILADKFGADRRHRSHVAALSATIFEQTSELHQLGDHDALLLNVAAILHEVGNYVSPKSHHKHSQYLIQNSEVFGLGALDVTIVALVARYHRRSGPKSSHVFYRNLPPEERIRVSKLAAILRVADALERTHSQRIKDLSVEIGKTKLRLTLSGVTDAAVERLALQSKGTLFHDVFGLEVVLVEQG